MKIELQRVLYMPKELQPGVLYVSDEFSTAAHVCPCGCGAKIRTPIGPTDWSLEDTYKGPTLDPSVGNWQQTCQSHYWIYEGEIVWADKLTSEQIIAGRRIEERRRRAYYDALYPDGLFLKLWRWLKGVFHRN